MDVMAPARAEREDLLDLLLVLTPGRSRAPSLCAGWTVQDVVAHLLSYEELGPRQLAARFARGSLRFDRVNAVGLREYGTRTPAELVDLLRRHLTPSGLTAGLGGAIALTDGLIHHQDIRRPLDRPRMVPIPESDRVRAPWPSRARRVVVDHVKAGTHSRPKQPRRRPRP